MGKFYGIPRKTKEQAYEKNDVSMIHFSFTNCMLLTKK
jgi:hypothetical protein